MALLPILEFPDPRLRTRAEPVQVFDAGLERLVADMFETMYAAPGVGLAGTQVDVHRQVIVMDTSAEKHDPQVYINAQILEHEGAEVGEEGCLSVPNVFESVKRAARVRARAQDSKGQVFERELTGLAAVCLQHELDHLAGKLFVDYLSMLKRERIRRKLEKERRERASGGGTTGAKPASAQAPGRVI
jgi:peptide deformylase